MKDGVVHYDYNEIHQGRSYDHNESADAEMSPNQHDQDSSANAENLGSYNEDIKVIWFKHLRITDSSIKYE